MALGSDAQRYVLLRDLYTTQSELKLILYVYLAVANDLLWPSWRKFNTVHLKSTELKNYMRKVFTKKIENSLANESWVFFGIQGVDASYVSDEVHFYCYYWQGDDLTISELLF